MKNYFFIALLALNSQFLAADFDYRQRIILQQYFFDKNMAYDQQIGPLIATSHPLSSMLHQLVLNLHHPSVITPLIKKDSQQAILYYLKNSSTIKSANIDDVRIGHPIKKNNLYYVNFKINKKSLGQLVIEIDGDTAHLIAIELSAT